MQIVPLVDELADRPRQHEHVLDGVQAAHGDHHPSFGRDLERRRQPGAVAPTRVEELALDPPAEQAHPFGSEQGGEPRAVVGPRREDEGAAAVVVVEQALHVRLGGPGDGPAVEEQTREPTRAGEAFDGGGR